MICKPGYQPYCPPTYTRPCQCVPKKGTAVSKPPQTPPQGAAVARARQVLGGMYDASSYPEGVPNPFEPAIEIYPNYVHGSDYTRPYFAQPYQPQPYNVVAGLGAAAASKRYGVLVGTAFGAGLLALLGAATAKPGKTLSNAAVGAVLGTLIAGTASWLAVESTEAA